MKHFSASIQFISLIFFLSLSACAPTTGIFGSSEAQDNALKGDLYFLAEGTDALPDFASLESQGSIFTNKLDIERRNFTEGFPGLSDRFEWFGIRYSGNLFINTEGNYSFELISDDGSKLYINNELIINNDYQHGPQSVTGNINLEEGQHTLILEYFQGPREGIALQFFVTPPNQERQIFQSTTVY